MRDRWGSHSSIKTAPESVNWEFAGHSVPVLDWGSAYDLSGGRAYVKGIWASSLNYRKSNSTFYWIGCTEFNRTYIYTAASAEGPWQKRTQMNSCYYDVGLLIAPGPIKPARHTQAAHTADRGLAVTAAG